MNKNNGSIKKKVFKNINKKKNENNNNNNKEGKRKTEKLDIKKGRKGVRRGEKAWARTQKYGRKERRKKRCNGFYHYFSLTATLNVTGPVQFGCSV